LLRARCRDPGRGNRAGKGKLPVGGVRCPPTQPVPAPSRGTAQVRRGNAPRGEGQRVPYFDDHVGGYLRAVLGGMCEMHWHPNADECYMPQGCRHYYIENTSDDGYRLLITFNSGHYQEIGLTEWLPSNPIRPVEANFEIAKSLAECFPREGRFLVPPPGEAG
jgi:hypothetical protein